MEIVAITAAVIGAYGSYQQGQAAKSQYGVQAKMATAEGERKQVQYLQRANDLLRRRNENNATLVARASAGGVDPFTGTADVVAAMNNTAAGREYAMLLADADAALRAGRLQAEIYESAGEQAARQGKFAAITKLGFAAAQAGGGTQEPAPIEDISVRAA